MDPEKLGDNKLFHPNLLERSYIAPEKLNVEKASQLYTYSKLDKQTIIDLQKMDIFSIGCILAEIFMSDNNALFEYPSIIKYRNEGDKSHLERINTIPHAEIKTIILKMLSLDPKERGTLKEYLPMFEKCVPKSLLTLYAYLNYVFRRSEFTQPDQKLGLIRLVAPLLLSDMQKELTQEENASFGAIFEDIKFRRCFPYHISRLGVLERLKTIVNSCPLNSFFNKETLIKYLDATGAAIQSTDMTVEAAKNPISSIYLEGAKFLRESPLNLDQKPYTKDEVFYQEPKDTEFNPKQTFKRIILEAQEEHKRNQLLERFSPICQLLETILSLIRNLQLSQSYLVGLELIEILSLFTSSEWITCIIFPHLHYRIEQQKSDFMEVRFSVKLFCELISRIRLVKPILAKRSAFVSYIKPLYDTCKDDPSLSIFIIRSVSDFIKANITLLLLQEVFKTVTINGKQDMDIGAIAKIDSDKVVELILASDKLANSANKFSPFLEQEKFFLPLLMQGLKTEANAFEILRALPKIYGYFTPQFVNTLSRELLAIQNKTLDAAFRSDSLVLIGSIMHYLPIENVRDFISHVKSCKFAPEEYTEMANAIRALTIILGHKDLTFLDKCEILESEKLFCLCPCSIVHKNALKLIETVYKSCTEDEITQAISPILSHLTDRMPAPDFETFELERYPPVTYAEHQKLVNTKKGWGTAMDSDNMAKYFEIVDLRLVISKKQPTNVSLGKRDFVGPKNLPRYIQEVLGCIAIFQIFKKEAEATSERTELLKKFESKDNSMTKEQSFKYLLKYFSDKLNDSSGISFNIRIDTRFTNTTENYVRLSNAKEEIIDQLSVKVDYKYIQQFNLSVLKIAMNYIQLLLNLTKFKSVTNRGKDSRVAHGDVPGFVNKLRKWRPAGHLCTTINAHDKAVKSLAIISSQAFASGSHDGHVKLHSLPAISRNFIHNSIEDVDINKDTPDSEFRRVNQVISLNKVSKIAIVNTSNQLLLCDDNKPKKLTQYDCKSRPTAATAYASDWLSNCVGCVTTDCEFLLWDVRQKKPAMQHNLSKIRGVPSSIARIGGLSSDYSTVITTHKGYVVNHDLRTNLTLFTRRLTMEGKSMPITSVAEFIPTTAFKNMSFEQRYILLTYPSKSNQFSIFPLGPDAKQAASPLVMFESGIDNKTSKPSDSPTLEDVSRKEEPLDFDGICDERFEYLNRVIQQPDNQFAIGNSFAIRSVASSTGLYRDNFHPLKMKIKKECLKNFEDIMQMQASISEYNMTINKVLCLPGISRERLKGEFEIDNILLTCGTDKNVRFLNFGNGLEKKVQDNLEYEYYNCYHLSNTDNMSRSFKFSYCHNMYLLKESPISNTGSQSAMNETLNNGQGPQKFLQNGLSQYHNQFLGSRKNADILPGHSANVTDILFVDNPETPLVITASDDSLIKIWS